MGMQLKFITKEEAHKLIDEMPGTRIMMLTYNSNIGISEDGRYIKKKCGKKYTDKAKVLVLEEYSPVRMLNLHDKFFSDFSDYKKEDKVRSILLTRTGLNS